MEVLSKSKDIINSILGIQNVNSEEYYRPFLYSKKVEVEDGILIFNCLTFELIFLNEIEMQCFVGRQYNCNDIKNVLINKWFLVPYEFDDLKLVNQVEEIRLQINRIFTYPKIKSFTILPTTECNARCFYCFERDKQKKKMPQSTAYQTAKYIIANKAEGKIKLRWFGGEPLCNSEAIDIICGKLMAEKTEFESYIITNGYLFDKKLINQAIKAWKLTKIQITLDGTEKIYNRIKNYVCDDNNPFERVMNNIKYLLENQVKVIIRLNMDYNNCDDLYRLTDEILQRFGIFENLFIYVCLLFEESCAHMKNMNDEIRHTLTKRKDELQNYISEKGKLKTRISGPLDSGHAGHCMADSNYSVMILPDGHLGKCQGYIDNHFWGNIFDNQIDFNELNWYKEIKTISKNCDECPFRPACVFPKCCINIPNHCNETERHSIESSFLNNLKLYYINYKSK